MLHLQGGTCRIWTRGVEAKSVLQVQVQVGSKSKRYLPAQDTN